MLSQAKPRDAVLFGLKFADNIHYKFKSSQARLQSSNHTGTKKNLTQNGHSRSLILAPIESAYATSSWSSLVTLVLSCHVSEILQVFC